MAWIPTLYVAEGLPYVAVNTLSVIMYKNLGMSNTDIAFYTGWLYLPWVIKPFWSPFVDIIKTKRWWTVTTQFIIGAAFAAIALTLPLDSYVAMSLAAGLLRGDVAGSILADRICLGHTRHCGGRILHARP